MLTSLFKEQRAQIEHFFDHVDTPQVTKVFEACLKCKGLIVFTGVGKSGIIGEKIAMTLTSTGTRALFLSSVSFLHGDIGILTSEDLVIFLSKSGETEELLDLIPYMRKRGVTLISIVSKQESRLAKASDLSLFLPVVKELCPFDLAPTTSTAVQLLFGDVLAIGLMRAKNFSLSDYALTHPSGTLGRKVTITVEEIMLKEEALPLCKVEDRLKDILPKLTSKGCGCKLIIDDQQRMLGIFTDGDLRRAIQSKGPEVLEETMGSLMTSSFTSINPGKLAWEALKLMQQDPKKWIMILPVLDQDKKVVGLLRMHDIIQTGLA